MRYRIFFAMKGTFSTFWLEDCEAGFFFLSSAKRYAKDMISRFGYRQAKVCTMSDETPVCFVVNENPKGSHDG